MLLEILFFLQEPTKAVLVSGHLEILPFHPGKKRGIVRMPNQDLILGISSEIRTERGSIVDGCIEVRKTFDSGQYFRGVAAEEGHEAGIPDPNILICKRLVHVGGLGKSRLAQNMRMGQVTGFPIQVNIAWFLVENRLGKF